MSEPRVVRLNVPATLLDVRKINESVTSLLRKSKNISEETIYAVELAVHEVCTNIVEHAYAGQPNGRIEVTCALDHAVPRSLVVMLRDTGRAFDPAQVPSPDLDTPQEGGYGMFLVYSLMDDVRYERTHSHNVWHLTKAM